MKIKCRRSRENLQSEDCELIGKRGKEEEEVKERRDLVKNWFNVKGEASGQS